MALEDITEAEIRVTTPDGIISKPFMGPTVELLNDKITYLGQEETNHVFQGMPGKYGQPHKLAFPEGCIAEINKKIGLTIVKFTDEIFFYGLFQGIGRLPKGLLFSYKIDKLESKFLSVQYDWIAKIFTRDGNELTRDGWIKKAEEERLSDI